MVAPSEPALVLTLDELSMLRAMRAMDTRAKDLIHSVALRYAARWPKRHSPKLSLVVDGAN